MIRLMTKKEKAEFVETLDRVKDAPEEVYTGSRYRLNGHWSKTATGSKAAERKWYMGYEYARIGEHVVKLERGGIDRTVYYDDEYPDPLRGGDERRKEAWMSYNLQFRFRYEEVYESIKKEWGYSFGQYDRPFAMLNYDGTSFIVWYATELDAKRYPEDKRRYLTDEELDEMRDVLKELRALYIKRLEAYWKRYKDNIHSSGYWANR